MTATHGTTRRPFRIIAGALSLAAAVVFLVMVFRRYEHPARTGAAAYLCGRDYRAARTATDTALIDGRRYPNGKVGPDLSCGILRRSPDWPL